MAALSCFTCRFANPHGERLSGMVPCRKLPPRAYNPEYGRTWPKVGAADWCGDHTPVAPSQQQGMESLAAALVPFLAIAQALEHVDPGSVLLVDIDLVSQDGDSLNLEGAQFEALADAWARLGASQ